MSVPECECSSHRVTDRSGGSVRGQLVGRPEHTHLERTLCKLQRLLGAKHGLKACARDLLESAARFDGNGGPLSNDTPIEFDRHHERHLLGAGEPRS